MIFRRLDMNTAGAYLDQYYLIRSEDEAADQFCHAFRGGELTHEPMLRKCIPARE